MVSAGGATEGYSEIGRLRNAIAPVRRMISAITQAKMGRSIKNLANTDQPSFLWLAAAAGVADVADVADAAGAAAAA